MQGALLSTAEVSGRDPVRTSRSSPIVNCEKPRDMERYWSMTRPAMLARALQPQEVVTRSVTYQSPA